MPHLSRWLLLGTLLSASACVGRLEPAENEDQWNGAAAIDDESVSDAGDGTQSPGSDGYDDNDGDSIGPDEDVPVTEPGEDAAAGAEDDAAPDAGSTPTPPPADDDEDPAPPVPPPVVEEPDQPTVPPEPPAPPPVSTACGDATETQELSLTNAARTSAGRAALKCDPLLAKVARAHSQDMCDRNYFSHTDLDGGSFATRIRDAGGSLRTGGENIAAGQRTPAAVHEAWMNSSGHRQNILNSGYGRIGIGYAACGGKPYWTQVFTD